MWEKLKLCHVCFSSWKMHMHNKVKSLEDEKSKLLEKLIRMCFNMKDHKFILLQAHDNFDVVETSYQHLHQ